LRKNGCFGQIIGKTYKKVKKKNFNLFTIQNSNEHFIRLLQHEKLRVFQVGWRYCYLRKRINDERIQ